MATDLWHKSLEGGIVGFVFIDESQDTKRFVLGTIATPDMLTAQGLIGDLRTAARRLRIGLHEFHEAAFYRDQPRLLTRGLELMSTAKRKQHAYLWRCAFSEPTT